MEKKKMGWFDEKDTAFIHIPAAITFYILNASKDQGNAVSFFQFGCAEW